MNEYQSHSPDHENIDWIVTPGLKSYVDEFIAFCKAFSVPPISPIHKKRHIIIQGDTGSGKSLFVEIYKRKYLKDYKIPEPKCKRLNCASVESTMILDELFGHVKGAYTGAIREKEGLIASAHEGLLILEEIGELRKPDQAKLLTFLEYGKYRNLGGTGELTSNVQIIATTHQNKDQFPIDFLNRFYFFAVPSLHARRSDILYYVHHFEKDILPYFTTNLVFALLTHNWPGNVSELRQYLSTLGLDIRMIKNKTLRDIDFRERHPELDSPPDHFHSAKYNIDFDDVYEFMAKIGFFPRHGIPAFYPKTIPIENPYSIYDSIYDIIKTNRGFRIFDHAILNSPPTLNIENTLYSEYGIPFYTPCPQFQKYNDALRLFCIMFWQSIDSDKDLSHFEEGSGLSPSHTGTFINVPGGPGYSPHSKLDVVGKTPFFQIETYKANTGLDWPRLLNGIWNEKFHQLFINIFHYKTGSPQKKRKKSIPQEAREQTCLRATQYWDSDKTITIKQMSINLQKELKLSYTVDTIHKWIKDFAPPERRQRGRPPESK